MKHIKVGNSVFLGFHSHAKHFIFCQCSCRNTQLHPRALHHLRTTVLQPCARSLPELLALFRFGQTRIVTFAPHRKTAHPDVSLQILQGIFKEVVALLVHVHPTSVLVGRKETQCVTRIHKRLQIPMLRFPVVRVVSPRIHQRVFFRHEFVYQAFENLPAVHFQRDATDAELVLRVIHQVVRPNGSTHTPPSPDHTGRSIGRDRECLGRPSGVYPAPPRTSI